MRKQTGIQFTSQITISYKTLKLLHTYTHGGTLLQFRVAEAFPSEVSTLARRDGGGGEIDELRTC